MANAKPSRPRANRPAGQPDPSPAPVPETLDQGPKRGEKGEYLPATYPKVRNGHESVRHDF